MFVLALLVVNNLENEYTDRLMDEEANCTLLVELQKENENPLGETLMTDKMVEKSRVKTDLYFE